MFSRKEQLIRKTGPDGIGRYDFLKQLINEFTTTRSHEAKRQTLANLANFAYDPVNYEYLKQLHVVDLFLAQLSENFDDLKHFALAGICNICVDPEFREYIIGLNGIYLISQLLSHNDEEIQLNALTTLFYLFESDQTVVQSEIIEKVNSFSKTNNQRLKNLSTIFLETYSSK